MDLKGFDIEHWWKVLAAGGAATLAGSAAVQNAPGVLIGLGLLLVGIGEWINHPRQTRIVPGWQITGYRRSATPAGNVCTIIGFLLTAAGVVKVLIS